MAKAPIQIHVHPPERRQRGGVVLYGTCCCSCCCCCLHVVGSVVGAILGSSPSRRGRAAATGTLPPEALERFRPSTPAPASDRVTEGPDEAIAPPASGLTEATPPAETPQPLLPLPDLSDRPNQSLPGARLYWLTVLVLTLIACVWVAFRFGPGRAESIILFVIFGLLPAVQLAASAVAALLVFLWPADERLPRWRTIGRISLWAFLGTMVGLLVMSPCLLPKW